MHDSILEKDIGAFYMPDLIKAEHAARQIVF